MIKFLEGQTYYAVPYSPYYSGVFEAGPYNKIILQRVDECPVGPVDADVWLQTADHADSEDWINVGDGVPGGVSTRSGLAQFVRVQVIMHATADAWADTTVYAVGERAAVGEMVWECTQAHTASMEDEPGGSSGSAPDWMDATVYGASATVVNVGQGTVYYCIQGHTSTPQDQPGVGDNWEAYWILNYQRYWTEYEGLLYTRITVSGKLVPD
jgi:Carbohydrate-binding module family 5/12